MWIIYYPQNKKGLNAFLVSSYNCVILATNFLNVFGLHIWTFDFEILISRQ